MSSNVRFVRAVKSGFSFAFDMRNFIAYLIVMLAEIGILVAGFIYTDFSVLANSAGLAGSSISTTALQSMLPYAAAFIITAIIDILFTGAFIYRYKTGSGISASVKYSYTRILALIGVAVVVSLVTIGVSTLIMYIGSSAAMVSSIAMPLFLLINLAVMVALTTLFLFVYQEVILAKSGIAKTLKNSWAIFKKDWINMLITLIFVSIVAGVVVLIFLIPFILTADFALAASVLLLGASASMSTLAGAMAQSPLFIATGLILMAGLVIAKLLTIGAVTNVYMQIKKIK